jgi:hypothetical protein
MEKKMSFEQTSAIDLNMPQSMYGMYSADLSSALNDGSANAADEGQRRVLQCAPFPARADVALCVAAWHGVLHYLRYNDEPVITGLLGQQADKCLPVITAVSQQTSLADLLLDVRKQWVDREDDWCDLLDRRHASLAEQLHCHAICLHGAGRAGRTSRLPGPPTVCVRRAANRPGRFAG